MYDLRKPDDLVFPILADGLLFINFEMWFVFIIIKFLFYAIDTLSLWCSLGCLRMCAASPIAANARRMSPDAANLSAFLSSCFASFDRVIVTLLSVAIVL